LNSKLGAEHPYTLGSMNNLADAYKKVGRLDEALPLFEEALKLRKVKLGAEHPDTLKSMNNLAMAYRDAARLDEALPLFEEALKLFETKLGAEHPNTLASMENLIGAYLLAKQPEKAFPQFQRLIAAKRAQVGADDAAFAGVLASVCLQLVKHGQFTAAEPYVRECLAIRAKAFPDDWRSFSAKSMLGAVLVGQAKEIYYSDAAAAAAKFAEAEPLLIEGYQGMKDRESQIPAAGKYNLADAQQRLVDLYTAWNKLDEAARWRKELDQSEPASR